MSITDQGASPDSSLLGRSPQPRKGRGRKFWAILATVVVVVLGGAIATTAVALRYAHAAPLSCACGLGWVPPDGARSWNTRAGSHDALNVAADVTRRQGFYVEIVNSSDVTQTILGLAPGGLTAWHDRLAVSVRTSDSMSLADEQLTYTDTPVDIPPGREATLRFDFTPTDHSDSGTQFFWDGVELRVRVGWFTRTETVGFGDTEMVVVYKRN